VQYLYDLERVLRESDGEGGLLREYTSTNELYGDLLSAYDGSAETAPACRTGRLRSLSFRIGISTSSCMFGPDIH
jgi:hypothetical protein